MKGVSSLKDRPSPNHGRRRNGGPIDLLIVHYTGMQSAAAALDRLCDPGSEVSAHYLIETNGTIWRLVDEARRAWHAGQSFWAGEVDVNSRSIGIELDNPGHGPDYRPFPDAQIAALAGLMSEILARHPIPPHRVLGHADVAPGRRRDPGELFDWRRLAARGIGLWSDAPASAAPPALDAVGLMRRFGYRDAAPEAVAAFQSHFRPSLISGNADSETLARLADLVKQAGLA
jgi:N-acetylmuramoyl-L-alanine amidase